MGVYAPVPCWWSRQRWLEHVERIYRRHYLLLRPRLVAVSGGGISLRAVLAVAAAHAGAADFGTGRDSRPMLGDTGGDRGLTAATGLGARTITRARTFLRLAGLATEVQPGRHRTLPERLDSWERGDRARGWTAVYALHHTSTHPVDNFVGIGAAHTPDGTPPRSGSLPPLSSEKKVVTTGAEHEDRGAARPASTTTGRRGRRRAVPDARGVLLATRWCQDPDSPPWARYKTPTTWAGLLALPARHGWTVRDLHRLLAEHTASGHHLLTTPKNPIAYLSWLLNQTDLTNRPCAMDDVYAAHEAELGAQRQAATPAQHAATAADRAAGKPPVKPTASAPSTTPAPSSSPAAAAPGEHHPSGGAVAAGDPGLRDGGHPEPGHGARRDRHQAPPAIVRVAVLSAVVQSVRRGLRSRC